jgi:hypothetical protein
MADIKIIQVGIPGPQGPVGPQGPAGDQIPENFEIAPDGFVTLKDDGRYSKLLAFTARELWPTHHKPLGIKAMEGWPASILIDASEMEEGGSSKRIKIFGIGDGVHVKAYQDTNFPSPTVFYGDTTHAAVLSCIQFYVDWGGAWTQTIPFKVTLKIAQGTITGDFTIYLPPFKLFAGDKICFSITEDGATYYATGPGACEFRCFAGGTSQAEESLTDTIYPGDNVVCLVGNTTNFHIGNKARLVSDNCNEWTRIVAINEGVSVTVNKVTDEYRVADNAVITKINCVRTPYGIDVVDRSMGRVYCLPPGVPSGICGQFGLGHSIDPSADIGVGIEIASYSPNPDSKICRMRFQYRLGKIGDPCTVDQYGALQYANIVPAVMANTIAVHMPIFTIPSAEVDDNKIMTFQIARMGDDAEDTFGECLCFMAHLFLITHNQFGMDARM